MLPQICKCKARQTHEGQNLGKRMKVKTLGFQGQNLGVSPQTPETFEKVSSKL